MLSVPGAVRILLWSEPIDMRKGFDGLAGLVRAAGEDALSGHLYVFVSRRRDRVKVLMWQRGGFVVPRFASHAYRPALVCHRQTCSVAGTNASSAGDFGSRRTWS